MYRHLPEFLSNLFRPSGTFSLGEGKRKIENSGTLLSAMNELHFILLLPCSLL